MNKKILSEDNDFRYEIKFSLDETELSKALSWLYASTSSRIAHPSRVVNSVYFDDPAYSSVRDNLAGISNRRKIRLRWYHNEELNKINGTRLEVKYRNGRLGHKDKFLLPAFEKDLMQTKYRDMFLALHSHLGGDEVFLMEDHLSPTLHVSYRREYYEGENGVRVTLDRPIEFYEPLSYSCPFESVSVSYPYTIMEIKFSPEQKDNVSKSLRRLNLTPKRHSKYLVGLAAFGQAIYY